jgi:alpha-L-rhamnosidase
MRRSPHPFLLMNNQANYKPLGFLGLYFIGIVCASAQSKAHEFSKFAIIDPAYSSINILPKSDINEKAISWIYGASELECWRLQLLQQRKDSAKLDVGYPGVFHKPYTDCSFRLKLKKAQTINSIKFRVVGQGKVYINDLFVGAFTENDSFQTVNLKKNTKAYQIRFDVKTLNEPPALLIESKGISTADNSWEWKSLNNNWEIAYHYPQNFQKVPPHKLDDPTIVLKPVSVKDNLYDFGKELFGFIIIQSQEKPEISIGESEPEALDVKNKILEQSLEVVKISEGLWKSKSSLAFRYLYLENSQIDKISSDAIFSPSSYKGAFACSDSTLTQIWMNSAYTLRLNMHDFLIDGIKRDRLPWTGDLAMSLLVDAYTFSDPELVRRSLVALGREGIKEEDINGIIDYSLWFIIAQNQYQLYFDDTLHLHHEWERIKEMLNDLSVHCDSSGFLIPSKETWLFIDWVEQEKWTALQILWWWAQDSGVKLAQRVGDTAAANYWINNSQKLKTNLLKVAWDEKEQFFLSKAGTSSERTRHPNFLAVVSGLATSSQYMGIKALLEDNNVKPVGTPYMAGFEVMALSQLGNIDYMLKHVKDYWGGMLKRGATTFWEAYDPKEPKEEQYSFYERPYGKSLCHAWSSGPAAFLPSKLFGLKPLDDGWKRFTLQPDIGSLQWASVCLPTKYGNIIVDIKNQDIHVSIPKGTILEWKGDFLAGPRLLKDKL